MEYIVKDLMVPISEYATVAKGSSLFEAVLALEKAQEEYDHSKYRHRAVLVMDQTNKVVGKLRQLAVLRAIISGNKQMEKVEEIGQFGFSSNFITALQEHYGFKGHGLREICEKPANGFTLVAALDRGTSTHAGPACFARPARSASSVADGFRPARITIIGLPGYLLPSSANIAPCWS